MTKREFFGETLEQATELASQRLGIPADDLNYERVPGSFSSLFKTDKIAIIVEYDDETQVAPGGAGGGGDGDAEVLARMDELKDDPQACSELVVGEILGRMGLPVAGIQTEQVDDQIILNIDLEGDPIDLRRGESREFRGALQYLINRIVHGGREGDQRFIIDFGGRLKMRAETMKNLAGALSKKAVETGKILRVKLMDSQDRRLLHLGLVEDERVKTFSEGEGRFRVLCVAPAESKGA